MEYEITKTKLFDKWFSKLKDRKAVLAISRRIDRAKPGNFGNSEPVGEGVSEIRIFVGKGYRFYYILIKQ